MVDAYVSDYLLFTFLASFGVLQIARSSRFSTRMIFGGGILALSYIWFFTSRDRDVHTVVEGSQLFLIFTLGAAAALVVTRILNFLAEKK